MPFSAYATSGSTLSPALTETNVEILTAEVFKQEETCVSGMPTTTIGPPTTGAHVLYELWKDALGGVFKSRRLDQRRGNCRV